VAGELDGVGGAVGAYVDDDVFVLGGIAHRCFGYALALSDGLEKTFSGLAAHVDSVAAGAVEAIEQTLEWSRGEVLVLVEGRDGGGDDSLHRFCHLVFRKLRGKRVKTIFS